MKNLDLFIAEKGKNATESTKRTYYNFYKRLETYLPKNKESVKYTREDFIAIISKFNTTTARNFVNTKSRIRDYFSWLVNFGEMTEQQLNEFSKISYNCINILDLYSRYYFKNFDNLYESLEETIQIYVEGEDEGEFDNLRCAIYLTWYGFTIDEVINLKKTDIDYNLSVVYKGVNHEPVKVSEKCILVLINHAENEEFMSRRYNKTYKTHFFYKDSQYLLRSYKNSQYTYGSINSMTNNINNISDKTGKIFAFKKIFLNGKYHRAYLEEQENGEFLKTDYIRLARIFEPNWVQDLTLGQKGVLTFKRLPEYKKYKKAFYEA